jgi:very-short-patch-repair endonuclease
VPHIYTRNSEKELRQSLRAEMPSAASVLWSKLRRRQLLGYKFRRQYSVGAYVVDFYCAELRLAIEVDGDSHFENGSQVRDKDREAFIKSFGIDFLRFRNVEVFEQLNDVLDAIARRVLEHPKPPCSPPLSKGERLSRLPNGSENLLRKEQSGDRSRRGTHETCRMFSLQ